MKLRPDKVKTGIANQAFDSPLVIALARTAVTVMDEVVRQEPAEQFGPLACAIRQDLRHKAPIIIVKHRLRHPPEERKGMDMAINPSLGHGSGISANKARIAVGKIKREEMRLLFNTPNHHHGLAKIRLGMTRGMCQRHKHLTASTTMFTDVILDRRVAGLEPPRHGPRTNGGSMARRPVAAQKHAWRYVVACGSG